MPRIPLAYPKMPGSKLSPTGRCIAFEKYDGTNLHWVWERELRWHAFGTRRSQFQFDEIGFGDFHAAHPGLDGAVSLFQENLAEPLHNLLVSYPDYRNEEIKVFTEYLGEESFAGKHKADDPKRLVIIDVLTPSGFVEPKRFLEEFAHLPIAQSVYRGRLTGKFIHDVREGKYQVKEGGRLQRSGKRPSVDGQD